MPNFVIACDSCDFEDEVVLPLGQVPEDRPCDGIIGVPLPSGHSESTCEGTVTRRWVPPAIGAVSGAGGSPAR